MGLLLLSPETRLVALWSDDLAYRRGPILHVERREQDGDWQRIE